MHLRSWLAYGAWRLPSAFAQRLVASVLCPRKACNQAEACQAVSAVYVVLQVAPYYFGGMEAIYAISPSTLFLLEGCGQTHYPGINWGDGFVADAGLIEQYGLSDPKRFFRQLLDKPYLDNV